MRKSMGGCEFALAHCALLVPEERLPLYRPEALGLRQMDPPQALSARSPAPSRAHSRRSPLHATSSSVRLRFGGGHAMRPESPGRVASALQPRED